MQYFSVAITLSCVSILLAFFWGGTKALALVAILSILEFSLSFDNAILNTTLLKQMERRWQQYFLSYGIIIAVFGVRFLLPMLIISMATQLGIFEVLSLAFENPASYRQHLLAIHTPLSAFAGLFLWMVFLSFLFDNTKTVHWLKFIEVKISTLRSGHMFLLKSLFVLGLLLIVLYLAPSTEKMLGLIAGLSAIALFILMRGIMQYVSKKTKISTNKHVGLLQFLYLEILDACFSLDGVIAAFAITQDIVIILLGLSIGAVFVRSLTLFLVQKHSLEKYKYLGHGAYYAIAALGFMMVLSLYMPIPDIIIGTVGLGCIILSMISSLRERA